MTRFLEAAFHWAWIVAIAMIFHNLGSCEMTKHRQSLVKECLVAGRTVQDCEAIK